MPQTGFQIYYELVEVQRNLKSVMFIFDCGYVVSGFPWQCSIDKFVLSVLIFFRRLSLRPSPEELEQRNILHSKFSCRDVICM